MPFQLVAQKISEGGAQTASEIATASSRLEISLAAVGISCTGACLIIDQLHGSLRGGGSYTSSGVQPQALPQVTGRADIEHSVRLAEQHVRVVHSACVGWRNKLERHELVDGLVAELFVELSRELDGNRHGRPAAWWTAMMQCTLGGSEPSRTHLSASALLRDHSTARASRAPRKGPPAAPRSQPRTRTAIGASPDVCPPFQLAARRAPP